jgi:hypothetical protein
MDCLSRSHTRHSEILCLFYVNKEKLNNCPQILISIGNERAFAVIDTVNQISLVKEKNVSKIEIRRH